MKLWSAVLLSALLAGNARGEGRLLDRASDLAAALRENASATTDLFDLTATVTYVCTNKSNSAVNLAVEDHSGAVLLRANGRDILPPHLVPGTRARFRGRVETGIYGRRFAILTASDERGAVPPPAPVPHTVGELTGPGDDYRLCRLTATLADVFHSTLDHNWIMGEFTDGNSFLIVSIPTFSDTDLDRLAELVGSRVTATGVCVPHDHNQQILSGKLFKLASVDDIAPLPAADEPDIGPLPFLNEIRDMRPESLARLGKHRVQGHVIATWQSRHALLRLPDGECTRVEFLPHGTLPRYGTFIEATGLPETDLFRLNLHHAVWQPLPPKPYTPESATTIRVSDIIQTSALGQPYLPCGHFQGKTLELRGVVRGLTRDDFHQRFILECDGQLVPVDVSSLPQILDDLSVGSDVRVTGACVLDTDSPLRSNSLIYRVRGFTLVPRVLSDLTVLSRPSWLTPARLLALVAALLLALLVIFVWNRILRHLVERRSRELFRAQIETTASELRVEERTRLAVELHDSLSQNLTGISFQVNMAERLTRPEQKDLANHLTIASKTLLSCRDELRNCIYDLRNQALDLKSIDEALRVTLRPHLENARLLLRFNVPRARLTDKTTHAILRIVRELVTNAVRHGRATQVAVAGALEGDRLLFSVRDDGCGFDPESRPGLADGHFGLQGIKERIRRYNGTLEIESAPGRGSRISVTLHLQPHSSQKENPT